MANMGSILRRMKTLLKGWHCIMLLIINLYSFKFKWDCRDATTPKAESSIGRSDYNPLTSLMAAMVDVQDDRHCI